MTDDEREGIAKAAVDLGECPRRLVAFYERHARVLNVTPEAFVLSLRSLFTTQRRVIVPVDLSDRLRRAIRRA